MKNVLLLLTCLQFVFTNFAQDDISKDIHWTSVEKSRKRIYPSPIGCDGSHVYFIKTIKKVRSIVKYNFKTMKIEKSMPFVLEYQGNRKSVKHSFFKDDKINFITEVVDDKLGKTVQFIEKYDKNSLNKISDKKIFEFSEDSKSKTKLLRKMSLSGLSKNLNLTTILTSPDEKIIAVINSTTKVDAEEQLFEGQKFKFEIAIIREVSSEVEKLKMKMPVNNFAISNMVLNDNGQIIILGYTYSIEEDKKLLRKSYRLLKENYLVFKYDINNPSFDEIKISDKDQKIQSVTMMPLSNGATILCGLTSSERGVDGTVSMIIDKDFRMQNQVFGSFEKDFIYSTFDDRSVEKMKKKNKRKEKRGKETSEPILYDYKINSVLPMEDNSSLMLAEQYYVLVTTSTTTDANGVTRTTTTYNYYYNDIIAVKFDKHGEIEWKEVIKKSQSSTNDGGMYLSFFPYVKDNQVYLIYNQRGSEVEEELPSRKLRKGYVASLIKITPEGTVKKSILNSYIMKNDLLMMPKQFTIKNDDYLFLYARKRKKWKHGVVKI